MNSKHAESIINNIGVISRELNESLDSNILNIGKHIDFIMDHGKDLSSILEEINQKNSGSDDRSNLELSNYCRSIIDIARKLTTIIVDSKEKNEVLSLSLQEEREKNMALQKRITQQENSIYFDGLTGLGNNYKYKKDLEEKLEKLRLGEIVNFVIISIDIDNIQQISELYGLSAKETLIKVFTQYVKRAFNEEQLNLMEMYTYDGSKIFVFSNNNQLDIIKFLNTIQDDISKKVLNYDKQGNTIKIKFNFSSSILVVNNEENVIDVNNILDNQLDSLLMAKEEGNKINLRVI